MEINGRPDVRMLLDLSDKIAVCVCFADFSASSGS